MSNDTSTERDWWDEDAQRLNKMADRARSLGLTVSVGPSHTDNAFCATGPGGGVDATCSPKQSATTKQPKQCPPPCDRPSKPEERNPNSRPKVLPYRDPPPKLGKKGGGQISRPKGDDSQTKIGDMGEKLATQLGFRSILPEGKRSFTAKEVAEKGSSIDLEYDTSGRLYELKVCSTKATEYRNKMKADEREAKLRYAENSEATPHILIGVHDADKQEIHFYGSTQPGLTGAEVSNKSFDYLGSVVYGKGKK